jgi:hypothetical protein
MSLQVGDRVRHSGYALTADRDYWQGCGTEPRKSRLKEAYLKRVAERGTVTAVLDNGLEVTWDGGSVSRCLSSRVQSAQQGE